jgi:phosphocarrier protein
LAYGSGLNRLDKRIIIGKGSLMKSFKYIISDEAGIHARPAGLLVKEVRKFKSNITIICRTKKADLKKLMALMGMGIRKGDNVTVEVFGEDEEEAASYLQDFFKKNF